LIGGAMNGVLVLLLAGGADASVFAIAQSGDGIASLAALLAFAARTRPHWPVLRDLAAIAISTGAIVLVLLPLHNATPDARSRNRGRYCGVCNADAGFRCDRTAAAAHRPLFAKPAEAR
jgi:hypothetical protein